MTELLPLHLSQNSEMQVLPSQLFLQEYKLVPQIFAACTCLPPLRAERAMLR